MSKEKNVVVVGLGEVGRPLLQLLSEHYKVTGVDITPPPGRVGEVDVLHICFPFEIKDFVGESARYIELYRPALTVINSTVAVGTTRAVAQRTGAAVAHSPVRGKHARMLEELRSYTKFVGGIDAASSKHAASHFERAGLKTRILAAPEATELAKLTETTYFGVLIAWAQEVERYADQTGQSYDELVSFYEGISFFPPIKFFPGIIGGHCVMPNIKILRRLGPSEILEAIESSNKKKADREALKGKTGAGNGNTSASEPRHGADKQEIITPVPTVR
jgi:UDP-N-acetyl-D-mannosaminuronate dehydrogenase